MVVVRSRRSRGHTVPAGTAIKSFRSAVTIGYKMEKHYEGDGNSMNVKSVKMICFAFVTQAFSGLTEAKQPTLQDSLLDKLEGAWVITGTIAGEEATHDLTVDWVNQQFGDVR